MRIFGTVFVQFIAAASLSASGIALAGGIATVNGKQITEQEFKSALKFLGPSAAMIANNPSMRERFLNHIIDSKLLSEKALKEKISDTADFKSRVEHSKNQILADLFLTYYIEKNSTEKKIKQYFDKNQSKFTKNEVKASHILVKEEKLAKTILADAKKPKADFAALAKKHSTGPSGPKGGDLGWFAKGAMVPEFEAAAFTLKKGEIYKTPVKTQFGYHIIKVVDKRGDGKANFADSKKAITEQLSRSLREELTTSLRKSAKIKIDKDALTKMKI